VGGRRSHLESCGHIGEVSDATAYDENLAVLVLGG